MTNDKTDQSPVQEMRRYIDKQAHTISRDILRIDLHRLLDKVCEAHEAENARLSAALKPVLECDSEMHRGCVYMIGAFKAVREAKRIFNESELK